MESAINDLPPEFKKAVHEELKKFPLILSIKEILGCKGEVIANEVILADDGGTIEELRYWGAIDGVKYKIFDIYSMEKIIEKFKEVKRNGEY